MALLSKIKERLMDKMLREVKFLFKKLGVHDTRQYIFLLERLNDPYEEDIDAEEEKDCFILTVDELLEEIKNLVIIAYTSYQNKQKIRFTYQDGRVFEFIPPELAFQLLAKEYKEKELDDPIVI
jgi:hypothetical protein